MASGHSPEVNPELLPEMDGSDNKENTKRPLQGSVKLRLRRGYFSRDARNLRMLRQVVRKESISPSSDPERGRAGWSGGTAAAGATFMESSPWTKQWLSVLHP